MARLYDVITFDCYGTLIDWEGGISSAFAQCCRGRDTATRPDADAQSLCRDRA